MRILINLGKSSELAGRQAFTLYLLLLAARRVIKYAVPSKSPW